MLKTYLILLFSVFVLFACSKKENKAVVSQPTEEEIMVAIYSEAVEALKKGDAFYAGKKFKEAESLLPQSYWAAKASLMHGYSHYSRNAYSDSVFSLEPEELRNLIIEIERAWQSLGNIFYGVSEDEKKSKMFRRSIYIAEDMFSGDIFTEENLRIVRPGLGLPPKYFSIFLGQKINKDVKKGTPMNWNLLGK